MALPNSTKTTIKTLEFKIYPTPNQVEILEDWLKSQQQIWNMGLRIFKDFEAQRHYNKHDKSYAPCCPIGWHYRWLKDEENNKWIPVPYSYRDRCDWYAPPQIENETFFSILPLFAKSLHTDKDWYQRCPYKLIQGTIKRLSIAWHAYRFGKNDPPRFKGDKNPLNTISDYSTNGAKVMGDKIKLPTMKQPVRFRNHGRWPEGKVLKTYHLKKEPSGWYIFLVGEFEDKIAAPSDTAVGLACGMAGKKETAKILHFDNGKKLAIPLPLSKNLQRLRRLQRKFSRCQPDSQNRAKLKVKLAKLHEKIRRQRLALHHEASTRIVRQFGAIGIEDVHPRERIKHEPKNRKKGTTKANEFNRRLLDIAFGSLITMLETKAESKARFFLKIPVEQLRDTCSACGYTDPENRAHSEFWCLKCQYKTSTKNNTARNLKLAVKAAKKSQ